MAILSSEKDLQKYLENLPDHKKRKIGILNSKEDDPFAPKDYASDGFSDPKDTQEKQSKGYETGLTQGDKTRSSLDKASRSMRGFANKTSLGGFMPNPISGLSRMAGTVVGLGTLAAEAIADVSDTRGYEGYRDRREDEGYSYSQSRKASESLDKTVRDAREAARDIDPRSFGGFEGLGIGNPSSYGGSNSLGSMAANEIDRDYGENDHDRDPSGSGDFGDRESEPGGMGGV